MCERLATLPLAGGLFDQDALTIELMMRTYTAQDSKNKSKEK